MKKLTQVYLIRHSKQLKIENKIVENEESQISNEKIILSIDGNCLRTIFIERIIINFKLWHNS